MDKKQMERWIAKNCKFAQHEEEEQAVTMVLDPDFNPDWADEAAYMAAGQPDSFQAEIHYVPMQFPSSRQTMESPGQEGGYEVTVTRVVANGKDILSFIQQNPRLAPFIRRFEEKKGRELTENAVNNSNIDRYEQREMM